MTVAIPRTKKPYRSTKPKGRAGLIARSQQGPTQGRATTARGVRWSEQWRTLRAGDPDVEELLEFVRRHRRLASLVHADHLQVPGSGLAPNGLGEENLIRDAAMDTDTDGDGVVDGWAVRRTETGWTTSFNSGEGAQELTADGTGSNADDAVVEQWVLRVFPGDEVTFSAEGKLANSPTDIEGRVRILWYESDGSFLSAATPTVFTGTSYERRITTATAPDNAAIAVANVTGRLTADSGSGTVNIRNARLLRASSDPATYANPHVSGGSQTGTSLDTAGWPVSTTGVVRKGDLIKIGGSGETQAAAESEIIETAFWATADADSDGSGNATLQIEPTLLNAPADGAALRLTGSRLRTRIVGHQIPEGGPGEFLDGMRVDFEEAP